MLKKVFLFPLSKISLQIGVQRPLNIFEPRYVQMLQDSLEMDIPIALCYGLAEREEGDIEIEHEVFSSVKVVSGAGVPKLIAQEEDSSSFLIMLPGEHKLRIKNILKGAQPYIVAECEEVLEETKLESENVLLLRRLSTQLEKLMNTLPTFSEESDVLNGSMSAPFRIVGMYTELLVTDPDDKQKVLELDDVNDKIQFLAMNSD